MKEDDLTILIQREAVAFQVPWALVKAICLTESSFNEWAFRHEPKYRWLFGDEGTRDATERIGQMSSWGLMQIMGAVARELGYNGAFPRLCDPKTNLHYGMLHLKGFYQKHGTWPDAIASYNAGRPVKDQMGQYLNQVYVAKVQTTWRMYDQTAVSTEL